MIAFWSRSLVFAIVVDLSISAPRNLDLYIINGDAAEPNAFPWQVSLQRVQSTFWSEQYTHICGGSLVSPSVVVTAAHCITEGYVYRIAAGSNDLLSGRQQIGHPRFITVHPEYNSKVIRNDIAVISLRQNFTLSPSLMPIRMARNETLSKCVTSGWGTTSASEAEYPMLLQKVELSLVDEETCRWLYMDVMDVDLDEKHICAGGDGKAACNGDSGGPLVCLDTRGQKVLTGVTSFGVADCGDRHPTVFTRISTYYDWILKNPASKVSPNWGFMAALLMCHLSLNHHSFRDLRG